MLKEKKSGSMILSISLIFALLVSMFYGVAHTNIANAAGYSYNGSISVYDSLGYKQTVGDFTIGGQQAFCVWHDGTTPPSAAAQEGYDDYGDAKIRTALYYGWAGPKNIFGNDRSRGIVVTTLVLSRLRNGVDAGGENISGYSKLWNLAQQANAPQHKFSFSDNNLSVSFKDGRQISQTTTLNGDSRNHVTINLPTGLHLKNLSRSTDGVGKETIHGGDSFYLWADADYSNNWSSGKLQGSIPTYQPMLLKFVNDDYQPIATAQETDPPKEKGISADFYPRTVNVYAQYIDTYDNSVMWQEAKGKSTIGSNYSVTASTSGFTGNGTKGAKGATYKETGKSTVTGKTGSTDVYVKFYYDRYRNNKVVYQNRYPNYQIFNQASKEVKVGNTYLWTIPKSVTAGGDTYDLYNNGSLRNANYTYTGKQPDKDLSKTFLYILKRSVTVNYYDNRTGKKIQTSKTYTLHQGDSYQENHPGITTTKNGKTYAYHFVKANGNAQKGTVGTGNIVINYYYDIPLAQVNLKKLQIYTAPASEGLPVKVTMGKVLYNYATTINDMSTKKISVSLYRGSTRIAMHQYAAKSIPVNLTFTIPSSVLAKDTNKPYTVRLDGFSANDFDVSPAGGQLTTQGYTSSEETVEFNVNSNSSHKDSQQRVVMTEITVGQPMETHYETFKYYARPIPKMKTGYGFAADVTLNYSNELGHDYNYATDVAEDNFTFRAPSVLQDTSYLNYPTKNGKVNVPMLSHHNVNDSASAYQKNESFKFPHVNVEDKTGKLFTDQQVNAHDSRIKNKLYDGKYQFYTPIWPDKSQNIPATYAVDYSTNPLGVNKVTLKIQDQLRLVAYMYAWMGSPTISKDELLMEPVNTDNPFPDGLPAGFTKADEQWIKND
ncbi:MAG: MucBP domain-containing protein [Sporolactobacillus sp.]